MPLYGLYGIYLEVGGIIEAHCKGTPRFKPHCTGLSAIYLELCGSLTRPLTVTPTAGRLPPTAPWLSFGPRLSMILSYKTLPGIQAVLSQPSWGNGLPFWNGNAFRLPSTPAWDFKTLPTFEPNGQSSWTLKACLSRPQKEFALQVILSRPSLGNVV